MKKFVLAMFIVVACLSQAQAGWPWETKKAPVELTAWGWAKGCECVKGEPCVCGPDCQCPAGVGCKGRSGSQSTGDVTYAVGLDAQQCTVNALGQKQCFVNGVQVPCDLPVQYVATSPVSSWAFPQAADPEVCPCCGMKMTAEQMATMKAKMAPVTYAAPATYSSPVTYRAPVMYMSTGACADGSCGTAMSNGGGRRGLFGRLRRGGCGG